MSAADREAVSTIPGWRDRWCLRTDRVSLNQEPCGGFEKSYGQKKMVEEGGGPEKKAAWWGWYGRVRATGCRTVRPGSVLDAAEAKPPVGVV
ncbi:hypothetical protein KM043_009610 [Ampulex compressa]|nr:hypothetical protein KM043_009610 [Ampulex compressa]